MSMTKMQDMLKINNRILLMQLICFLDLPLDAITCMFPVCGSDEIHVLFGRIDDFEFTRECAIFDLLDIPLYHGWIVDPQDHDTRNAIGSKSYNTLMGELVSLDTQNMDNRAAAERRCEEARAAEALQLSEAGKATSSVETDGLNSLVEIPNLKIPEPVVLNKKSEGNATETQPVLQHEALISTEESVSNDQKISGDGNLNSSQLASKVAVSSSLKIDQEKKAPTKITKCKTAG
ncbi:hypothetical protein HAX54_015024 [Datura stramonium]|uniref:MINDY deubiquitinase domain-containing protein n=1 Tax=Datura stramonium TaxID=4076 RepID=A0ABS8RZR7_DATST|nr:hypothetical protein [Datura stramonium]